MISDDLRRKIADHLSYNSYDDINKIGLMLRIPCGQCSGKGHNEFSKLLDNFTSIEDVKCKTCDGKGYELERVSIDQFVEISYILLEDDYNFQWKMAELIEQNQSIQDAIMKVVEKNAVKVIDTFKTAVVANIMET